MGLLEAVTIRTNFEIVNLMKFKTPGSGNTVRFYNNPVTEFDELIHNLYLKIIGSLSHFAAKDTAK